ncbi:hypothetical protein DFJ74DRAFT_518781 [Hyaloraphidium curvatum]|nr:hypothetical protein DFJ74DRAFT_518781 [Hyaloraphidium curvatum]
MATQSPVATSSHIDDGKLTGKLALVTGASGGIGRAVAQRLAALEADLALTYFSHPEECTALASELAASYPSIKIKIYKCDMSDPSSLPPLLHTIEFEFDKTIDVLIANAGRAVRAASLEELTVEEFEKTHATNLKAPFVLAKLTVPGMKKKKWGRIVFVGSIAGFTGGVVGPHYASSKSGLNGLCHWIAANHAKDGITSNIVAPALIEGTIMMPDAGQMASRIPVGRAGKPEEVARVVETMVLTGYLTNQTILVDGGLYPT